MRKRTKYLLITLLVLAPAIAWAIAAGDQEVSGDLHVNGGEFFLGTGTATTTFSTTGTALTVTSGVASSSAANVIVSGNLGIGTTTAASNRLTIDSGSGSALAIRNSGSKTFEILNTGPLYTYAAASTYDMWNSQVNGESFARAIYNADGLIEWGSGSAATDTNLYRSAASTLKTDDTLVIGSSFQQLGATNSYFTGNVGIGTTSPSSLLTIEPSTTTATSTLEISNKGSMTNGSCIQMHSPNGARYRLYVSNAGVLTTEAGKCQ